MFESTSMLESWELSLRKLWAEVNKNVISDLVLVCGSASCSKQSSSPSTRTRIIGKIKKEEMPGLACYTHITASDWPFPRSPGLHSQHLLPLVCKVPCGYATSVYLSL